MLPLERKSWSHRRLPLMLAIAALSLACKSAGEEPPAQAPTASVAGAGGAAHDPPGADAGATATQGGAAGNTGLGEGGELSMPGAGGEPSEPGSWDESFWDKAVWQ